MAKAIIEFIRGAGSILDIYPSVVKEIRVFHNPSDGFRDDAKAIGNDFKVSIQKFVDEQEKQSKQSELENSSSI